MGSTQSSHLDSQRTLQVGVLADYETIYNYFDDVGQASLTQKTKIRSAIKKKSNETAAASYAASQGADKHSKSLYEEAVGFGGDQSCSADDRVDCGRRHKNQNSTEATAGTCVQKIRR